MRRLLSVLFAYTTRKRASVRPAVPRLTHLCGAPCGFRQQGSLCLLREVHRRNRVLANRLLILFVELGVLRLDDFPHFDLGQFLRHQVAVKNAARHGLLILHERRDDLVKVLAAHPFGLVAFRLCESCDLDLNCARLGMHADVALTGLVPFGAVINIVARPLAGALRAEVEARREHLFHQKTRRNRLERIVHRLGDQPG